MSYSQEIYDAARSKISGGDVGSAVENAVSRSGIGDAVDSVKYEFINAAVQLQELIMEHARPCVIFKPVLSLDGDTYCVLYGENLMSGCVGFGKTPSEAMADFDKAWSGTGKAGTFGEEQQSD